VRRREFITLLGGAAAVWPIMARAQQPDRMRRIGVLVNLAEDDPEMQLWLTAFRQGLEKLGWSEGRNVRIDYRFHTAGADQVQVPVKELVALQPDVILAEGTSTAAAFKRESRAIPIVFVAVSDPIGSGFIASLARPGGNLIAIGCGDLLHNVNDPGAHGRTRNPHELWLAAVPLTARKRKALLRSRRG